jgi:hypothetical protein
VLVGGAAILSATIQAPWQLYVYTGVLGALGVVRLLLARTAPAP